MRADDDGRREKGARGGDANNETTIKQCLEKEDNDGAKYEGRRLAEDEDNEATNKTNTTIKQCTREIEEAGEDDGGGNGRRMTDGNTMMMARGRQCRGGARRAFVFFFNLVEDD